MNKLHTLLDLHVANFSVLFTKLHHYHWFVEGPQFHALHEKFEELYDEVNELYDSFAERLVMIGGRPSSSLKGYLAIASLQEAGAEKTAKEMILAIVNDLKLLVIDLKELIKVAQDAEDEVTADLAIGTLAGFEKTIWMLSATAK